MNDADASLVMWTPPADLTDPSRRGGVSGGRPRPAPPQGAHAVDDLCGGARHHPGRGIPSQLRDELHLLAGQGPDLRPAGQRGPLPGDPLRHRGSPGGAKGAQTSSGRITTMFAVALPKPPCQAMGRFRIGPTSALITFGNVRLGAWLPNPRYVRPGAHAGWTERPVPQGAAQTWSRMLRHPRPVGSLRLCSDGGHWENTGLVEALGEHASRGGRRRRRSGGPRLRAPAVERHRPRAAECGVRCTSTLTRSAVSDDQAIRCSRNARWPWE